MTSIRKDELEQVFELIGRSIRQPVEISIAGSIPSLIGELTARPTDDIDIIDEVPQSINEQREILEEIEKKYGLSLRALQSHYLPQNWQNRRHLLGRYGELTVYFADEYDIFVSKLSSKREKHQDDLRVMAATLDRVKAKQLLNTDGEAFLNNPADRATIEENWQFVYREPLSPK